MDHHTVDEKHPVASSHASSKKPSPYTQAMLPSFYKTLLLILSLMVIYGLHQISTLSISSSLLLPSKKIPLEVHVIAKCSQAKTALTELVYPAIQQVYDEVDFRLTFIATPLEDGGVECRHGEDECEASILELCAQDLYSDPRMSLGFITCITAEYERIPDRQLYETCAEKHSLDMKAIDHCASKDGGAYGLKLLRDSAQRSIDLHALVSCTIRLNDRLYCRRNEGVWEYCNDGIEAVDLVHAVNRLYNAETL